MTKYWITEGGSAFRSESMDYIENPAYAGPFKLVKKAAAHSHDISQCEFKTIDDWDTYVCRVCGRILQRVM